MKRDLTATTATATAESVARDLMAVMDGKGSDGYNCDSYRQTVDLQILQKRMPACNANNQ